MFNEVRMFEGRPVRLWAPVWAGRFVIFADGLMRYLNNAQLAELPLAPAGAVAFPPQDQGDRA
jgi:hypothetical protein